MTKQKILTEKQKTITLWIKDFIGINWYAPTSQEVGDAHEMTKKAAYDHIKAIIKKGYMKSSGGQARTLNFKDCPDLDKDIKR